MSIRKLPAFLFVALCAVIMPTLAVSAAWAQEDDVVVAEMQAEPASVVGESVSVLVTLTGNTTVCPPDLTEYPVDVVMVIDVSGSMRDAMPAVKQAALAFLDALDFSTSKAQGGDQVGLVSFESGYQVLSRLTQDYWTLAGYINSLQANGGTSMSGALREAVDMATYVSPDGINSHNYEQNASPVVVILSDGEPSDTNSTLQEAARARAAGVRVITIGLGGESNPDFLQQVAYQPGDFYDSPSAAELYDVYTRIARAIQPGVAAEEIAVTYRLTNTTQFSIVPGSANPSPISETLSELQWTYSQLRNGKDVVFSFELLPQMPGVFALEDVGLLELQFTACQDPNDVRSMSLPGPQLNIQAPTSTPLPTETPTPSPSPTPTVAPTPTMPFAPGDGTVDKQNPGITAGFCDGVFWNYVIPLIVLLLLLLLVLLWARVLWGRYAERKITFWCMVAGILPLLYLALFIPLFLIPPFIDSVCPVRESVYFWRQSGDGMGIFFTHADQGNPVAYQEINETGCVGCHAVSSSENARIASIRGTSQGFVVTVFDLEGNPIDIPEVIGYYVAWSPDGTRLAIATDAGDIEILDITTGQFVPLQGANDPERHETMPSWGPNGTIAFVSPVVSETTVYNDISIESPCDIYVVPETGGTAVPLQGASGNGFNYYPAYSPDGKWLAFTHHANETTYSDPLAEIYLVPAEGGEPVRLDANGQPGSNNSNSWPSWDREGSLLAFNSRRDDVTFDVFITRIDPETGQSGETRALSGASERGVFEHTPFWGMPVRKPALSDRLQGLLPWLLVPPILLALLALLICFLRRAHRAPEISIKEPPAPPPAKVPEPVPPTTPEVEVLWEVQPTLVIGLGESGRWVLTHLKKNLRDAGLGNIPSNVRLLCIDTGDYTVRQDQDQPVSFAGVELTGDEMLDLRDNLSDIVRRESLDEDETYRTWFNATRVKAKGDAAMDLSLGIGDERVLGRAALIENLRGNLNQTRAKVWNLLTQAAKQALDEQGRLHVVLVASSAEGFGSATLWDMAYLTRLASKTDEVGAKGCTISAHLMTAKAIQKRHRNLHHAKVNSGATLRELFRFQLAEARPVTFEYGAEALDGVCDWLLIDELTLYDGFRGSAGALFNEDPRWGVYPSVADSIASWMDKAARQGELWRQRTQQTTATRTFQTAQRTVAVRSQGTFQFRLPFYDLLEILQLRFARELVHRLLMGETSGQPRLDASLAVEQQLPQERARAFWSGRMEIEPNRHPWIDIGYAALVSKQDELLRRGLRALNSSEDAQVLCDRLASALTLILNGPAGNVFVGRQAKIGYASQFLDGVESYLPEIEQMISAYKPETPALAALQTLRDYLDFFREALNENASALGVAKGEGDSLYELIHRRGGNVEKRQEEMDRVLVRQYFWHHVNAEGQAIPLVDAWYRSYLMPHMEEALGLFFWKVLPNGGITLKLLTAEDEVLLDADDLPAFEDAILKLAKAYCMAIRDTESLAKLLQQNNALRQAGLLAGRDLYTEDLRQTALNLFYQAEPLLNYDKTKPLANAFQQGAIISVNPGVVAEAEDMERELQDLLVNPGYLERVAASDPYVLGLSRTVAVIPVEAASEVIDDLVNDYRQAYELVHPPRDLRPNPIMSAVYEAEATALMLERNLDLLKQRRDLLDPIVVAMLADARRARAFCLALASDAIGLQVRRNDQILTLIIEDELPLVTSQEAKDASLPILLTGALYFIHNIPERVVNQIFAYEEDEYWYNIWDEWTKEGYKQWLENLNTEEDRRLVNDLIKVARLWASGVKLRG